MTRTTCHMSISLDGFVAGPDQSRDDPVGFGGLHARPPERLFEGVQDPGLKPVEVIHSPHATHVRYRIGI